MKLVAGLIVAVVERDRYLIPCVESLLGFCDEVVLLFDGDGRWSADLVGAWGADGSRVIGVTPSAGEAPVDFFAHEGRARQRLLDATLARAPSHVLAVDADEFVADGQAVRDACTEPYGAWYLCMEEVWNAHPDRLELRVDGGWEDHDIPALWAVAGLRAPLRIADRALACGRVPDTVRGARTGCAGTSILHFGWANQAERVARHERYAVADGGRFHASAHLDSILWPTERVALRSRPWPNGLPRAAILARAASA